MRWGRRPVRAAARSLPRAASRPLKQTLLPALGRSWRAKRSACDALPRKELFALGRIHLSTDAIHTVKPLDIEIPKGRLTVVTGVSGSGKTTLMLESLFPALEPP